MFFVTKRLRFIWFSVHRYHSVFRTVAHRWFVVIVRSRRCWSRHPCGDPWRDRGPSIRWSRRACVDKRVAYDRVMTQGRQSIYLSTQMKKMGLNIKNEETCRLAGELARLTGETMTGAITVALRERLQRESHKRSVEVRVQELRSIAERCARLLGPGPSAVEHGDFLYDERGLPK